MWQWLWLWQWSFCWDGFDDDKIPLGHPPSPYFQCLRSPHGHSSDWFDLLPFSKTLCNHFSGFSVCHNRGGHFYHPLPPPFMKSLWSVLRPRLSWGQMVFCIKHSHFLSPMTVLASKLEVPTNLVLISLFFVPVAWASKSLNWNCFVVPSYPACLSESASLLWNPWLAEFLIWKVKPRPGNHFCFFGLALPQIGRWGKTSAVAISQPPPCHNQFQGRLLLMPSLHLMSSRGRFAAACQQPVWAAPQLHSRSPPPSWNSLLPLPARSGSRLVDKVRGGARGESNPTIILTCLTMVLHPLHAPTPPPCLYDLPFSPQPPFFATLESKLPTSNLPNPSLSLLLRIHWRQAFYRESNRFGQRCDSLGKCLFLSF